MSKPKDARTYQEQLDLLKARGLAVADEPAALHCLEHHNYYRLSPYRFPFTQPGNRDAFQPGSTFEQLWALYTFDRQLRHLVIEGCKSVEISLRSRWAYEVGHRLGPLGYLDNRHFSTPLVHATTLVKLHAEMERSKEDFIKHHRGTLLMPWPPAWVIVEIASFGNISTLLSQLRQSSIRQAIADPFGLDEQTFCSLMHHLSVLRNTAAHHSRLWNRLFVFKFKLPRKKPPHLRPNFYEDPLLPKKEGKIHNTLLLLIHLLRCIDPATDWPDRLIHLLRTLDAALIPEMGFPADWQTRPMWAALLAANP
ncbi:MAG: Abi family protein [Verrucomicrobiaceae bacterium]|nr:Abi family protein [Verrucomicrobiaceae bacterium]